MRRILLIEQQNTSVSIVMKLFLIFDQVENQIEDMNKGDRRGMNNE